MNRPLAGQRVLVVGPGWLGQAVAATTAERGASVWTLQRRAPNATASGSTLSGDIRAPEQPASWLDALPSTLDHVVVTVAPSFASGDDYPSTYPAAVRGALRLAAARQSRSIVYTSSTGVYGRTDGGPSRETDVIVPRDARQQALHDAEQALADGEVASGVGRTVLRAAGLYGPGRDPAPRFLRGIPVGDDDVWCNFSWRDDVVDAVIRQLETPPAPGICQFYNCADGAPLRASVIARALGATTTAPPTGMAGTRSNQRIVVEALRLTGWRPTMETVFDGLSALGYADHTITRPVTSPTDGDA